MKILRRHFEFAARKDEFAVRTICAERTAQEGVGFSRHLIRNCTAYKMGPKPIFINGRQ